MTGEAHAVVLNCAIGNPSDCMLPVCSRDWAAIVDIKGEFVHINRSSDYPYMALPASKLGGVQRCAAVISGSDSVPARSRICVTGSTVAGDGVGLQMMHGRRIIEVTALAVHINIVHAAGNYGGDCCRIEFGSAIAMTCGAIAPMKDVNRCWR